MAEPEKHRNSRIKCGECSEHFSTYVSYRKHLAEKFPLEHELKTFPNKQEFNNWKENVEKRTTSMFVKDASTRKLKHTTVEYYLCHRSYEPKRKDQKSKEKTRGSNKCGIACPSSMKVSWDSNNANGPITVEYHKTHLFHECELGRMVMHKNDRTMIAGKLADGVDRSHILGDIRDNVTEVNERVHLLNNQDILNIQRDFRISCPMKRHTNDAVSVQMWINEMKQGTDNPVLFQKKNDEDLEGFEKKDYVLIIMTEFQKKMFRKFSSNTLCFDGTHGTNSYGYILYTLLVIDEFGEGIPIAFMFSNRKTENLFSLFFETIKSHADTNWKPPRVFMSDGEETFYNAFKKTIGEAEMQLLCMWHVHKNWTENYSKIEKTKKNIVRTELIALSKEIDPTKFEDEMKTFMQKLIDDNDTKAFHKYLNENYIHKKEKWALCYRINADIHTNMSLENFHKVIKYDYLHGRRCVRIDKTLYALFTYLRDKKFNRLIAIVKDKPYKYAKETKERHVKSLDFNLESILTVDENLWYVSSETNKEKLYVIERVKDAPCCKQLCRDCNICLHMFKCSCNDNILKHRICKHIHACHRLKNPVQSEIVPQSAPPLDLEFFDSTQYIVANEPAISNKRFRERIDLLRGLASEELDDETLKTATDKIDKLIGFIAGKTKTKLPEQIEKSHALQKIDKQTFFPKKASKRKAAEVTYASNEHEEELRHSLLLKKAETTAIQMRNGSVLDHHYG